MLTRLVNHCPSLPCGSKLLILGGGFSGQRIASVAKAQKTEVLCSRRSSKQPCADFIFDSVKGILPSKEILKDVTHLISCIPPNSNGKDPVLESFGNSLKDLPLKWVGYLSTTGVYGDSKGNWVEETDIPHPKQERSKRRLSCEIAWENSGLPIQILRLPGIYGPGRSAIESIQSGKSKMIDKPGQIFSRIHVDDIAGATYYLIDLARKGTRPKIVNIADNMPTANLEVLKFAASLIGSSLPPIEPFEIAIKKMSPMAQSFWQENRRVSNQLLCKKLGYSLIYPDYQTGLKNCLRKDQ